MKFVEKWMDLKHFLLIDVAQAKKVKCFLICPSKYGTMIHVINLRNQESETGRFLLIGCHTILPSKFRDNWS